MVDQVRKAAGLTSVFDSDTFGVLDTVVRLSGRFSAIPFPVLVAKSRLPGDRCRHAVDGLLKEGAMLQKPSGLALTSLGLDTAALHHFAREGLVDGVGPSIGMGKESDVYEALKEGGSPLAVKLFRMGRTSFRDVRRKRGYGSSEGQRWVVSNMNAAKRESDVLRLLDGKGLPVPRLITRYLHAILMQMELGVPLYKVRELEDSERVLRSIMEGVKAVWGRAGLVNSDMSEYNILLTPEHRVVLIDWPQAVSTRSPTAIEMLRRDLTNTIGFFSKRFGTNADVDEMAAYCVGASQYPGRMSR